MPVFDEHNLKDEELSGGFLYDDEETFAVDKAAQQDNSAHEEKSDDTASKKDSDEVVSETVLHTTAVESQTEKTTQEKEETATDKTAPKVKVITPTIHKVEKKPPKKKHTIGIWVAALLVALLIITAAGWYLYKTNSPMNFLKNSYVDNLHQETNSEDLEQDVQVEEIEPANTQQKEDEQIEDVEPPKPQQEQVSKADKNLELSENKTPATTAPIKKEFNTQVQTKSKPTVQNTVKEPVIKKEETRKTEPVKTVTQTKQETKKKPDIEITPKPEKEVTASKIITNTHPEPKPKMTKTLPPSGLFVVEVYSTTSYDEAKIWMDKLNRRNLNAAIVTQRIRNKIFYKVRFGRFPTEFDARQMAMKLGFSRFYIDRIK